MFSGPHTHRHHKLLCFFQKISSLNRFGAVLSLAFLGIVFPISSLGIGLVAMPSYTTGELTSERHNHVASHMLRSQICNSFLNMFDTLQVLFDTLQKSTLQLR